MKTETKIGGLAGNDRAGWYVQWQDGRGFRSAMPDRKAAVLCAAAPELLEALKDCADLLNNSDVRFMICDGGMGHLGEHSRYHRIINATRAAIARAEGMTKPQHSMDDGSEVEL